MSNVKLTAYQDNRCPRMLTGVGPRERLLERAM